MHSPAERHPEAFRDGFLSELIGMPAHVKGSASRTPAGKIVDFLISHPEDTFPRVDAVKIKTKDGMRIVPIAEVAVDRDGPLLLDTFPAEMVVYPGHMGITTLGRERATNPFLRELAGQ